MGKAKALFTYKIIDDVILITDQGGGRTMTVTNDIENVLVDIAAQEHITVTNYMVVYMDTDATWDGWNPRKEDFILLNANTPEQAVQLIRRYYNS